MEYLKLIDLNKDEMIEALRELVSIKSVESPAETIGDKFMPFGAGVQEAFEYMLTKAKQEDFDTENVDNYGGHIDFGGYALNEDGEIIATSDETMGIIVHLDVVPEGDGWTYDPYSGHIEEGRLYGRGTTDDKGPAIACFYAMKALKDSGYMPSKRVRLILGLDEETNWSGIKKYFQKVKAPDFGFTPDAEFPAIHGEKGLMIFTLAKKFNKSMEKGLGLRSIKGGNAPNMVADSARAVLFDSNDNKDYGKVKQEAEAFAEATGAKLKLRQIGKSMEVIAQGVSAHGANPQMGINAISVLLDFLGNLKFVNEDLSEFIEFYNKHIGMEVDGTSLGCGFEDEESGKLVLNVGMAEGDSQAISLTINVRYPVTKTDEEVYKAIDPVITKYNMGVIKGKHHAAIYKPKDDPMIATLMDIYREYTGDKNSEPIVIGGGTYARACSGIIAFGATFPGCEEKAHQKDEYIDIDSLVLCAKIYAEAIYRLTKED